MILQRFVLLLSVCVVTLVTLGCDRVPIFTTAAAIAANPNNDVPLDAMLTTHYSMEPTL